MEGISQNSDLERAILTDHLSGDHLLHERLGYSH